MAKITRHPYVLIITGVLISTCILYLPFITHILPLVGFPESTKGMSTVYQNYDGVLYLVPAKTWYNPESIRSLRLELTLPEKYYAAHLPLYPFFVYLVQFIFGYLPSLLLVSVGFTVLLAGALYKLVQYFKLSEKPLVLIAVFLFLPRFLVVRSVGAPESLFMLCIIGSIYFFEKKNYLVAGLIGGLAAATKTPGILLFPAYLLVFLEQYIKHRRVDRSMIWILFIPIGLAATFFLYQYQYGDFFAYFHTSGLVPMPYPFSVFDSRARWVQTPWLEEIILYFFIYGYAILNMKNMKERSLFYFPLVFFVSSLFVQHRDLSRYMLPLWPFALISYEKLFTSKKFILILCIFLPAIYLYAINFMLSNILPVSDWRPYL